MIDHLETILLQVSRQQDIDNGDLSAASQLILTSCCDGLNIERAGIWRLADESQVINCEVLLDQGTFQNTEALVLTRKDFPNYFASLDTERRIAAHDAHTHEATAEFSEVYLTPLNINSMLDVPIRHKGAMVGIICCEHRGPARQWSDDEIVFASAMADLYGRAISAEESQAYQRQLEEINASLESKVEERTRNLQQALENLTLAQDRLVESEKLVALGSLVAGVAHEVNTPLGIAVTSVSLCQEELRKVRQQFESDALDESSFKQFMETSEESLSLAIGNLTRAATLIKDFKLTAADQSSNDIDTINLAAYISHVVSPLTGMLKKKGVQLSLELKEEIKLRTYPGIVAQILTNLITNALNHGFKEDQSYAQKQITVELKRHGNEVDLSVNDTGSGITPENIKKIFEPFFTTARGKGGTGLGLSICYNLIRKNLHGTMMVESQINKGTTFTIQFPIDGLDNA